MSSSSEFYRTRYGPLLDLLTDYGAESAPGLSLWLSQEENRHVLGEMLHQLSLAEIKIAGDWQRFTRPGIIPFWKYGCVGEVYPGDTLPWNPADTSWSALVEATHPTIYGSSLRHAQALVDEKLLGLGYVLVGGPVLWDPAVPACPACSGCGRWPISPTVPQAGSNECGLCLGSGQQHKDDHWLIRMWSAGYADFFRAERIS